MEKSVNLRIIDAKEDLMKVIVESKLPAVVVQMILHEIAQTIDIEVARIVDQEKKQYDQSKTEE